MKVAVYHNLPSGGGKRALFEVLSRLSQRHTLDIFTLSTANSQFCDVRPYANQHTIYPFLPPRNYPFPFRRLYHFGNWLYLGKLEKINRKIASHIDQGAYDVVYATACRFTNAPAIMQYLRTPSVLHIHEALRSAYEPILHRPYASESDWHGKIDRIDPFIRLHRRKMIEIDRKSMAGGNRLLCNSSFSAKNIEKFYHLPAQVAYFGVDCDEFHPIEGCQRENTVISVGALRADKGFDFLIEGLSRIPAESRPQLRIITNYHYDPEAAYLRELASIKEVSLVIETMVAHATLVQRYNQAKAVVYAPINEPFGFVPLEGMACGTPVVGIAEGGVCETIRDGITGYLVNRNVDEFAALVCRLLQDAALRTRLGKQARDYVAEHWTWDRSVESIEEHLADAADKTAA